MILESSTTYTPQIRPSQIRLIQRIANLIHFSFSIFRLCVSALCIATIVILSGQPLLAQTGEQENSTLRVETATEPLPIDPLSNRNERDGGQALSFRPPLPNSFMPRIAPIIRRPNQNDIELRTRAFHPHPNLNEGFFFPNVSENEKWIRVDLGKQMVVAYIGKRAVRGFSVSTGTAGTPTVTGEFNIRMKVSEQVMSGGYGASAYWLPGVKWVQYFFEEYSFHGTWWHNNFGEPMSHGCVNMTNADAKWLFDWAGPTWDGKTEWYLSSFDNPGTRVIVHE